MKRILLYLLLCLFFSFTGWWLPWGLSGYSQTTPEPVQPTGGSAEGMTSGAAPAPKESFGPSGQGLSKKTDYDAAGEDLRTILRHFAEENGLNIAIGDDVQGQVNVKLKDVSLETILKTILLVNGYDYFQEDDIIIITKKGKVKTITRTFHLDNVDAASVRNVIQGLLSPDGEVLTFVRGKGVGNEKTQERSNLLIVRDNPANIEDIERIIKTVDTPAPQVLIEARIMEVNVNALDALGINWNVQVSTQGPSLPTTFPLKTTQEIGPYVPPPKSAPNAQAGDRIAADDAAFKAGVLSCAQFTAVLKLLQSRGPDVNLLAQPRIMTLDNQEAEIVIGDIVPIPRYAYNEQRGTWEITGYTEQKVGITLTSTPHITSDNHIALMVKPEISEIVGWVVGPSGQNEKPQISTRRADTQVRIKDNETIVIGGLIKVVETVNESKIPFLGDIPILGGLFRSRSVEKDKIDLLIFITPRIMTEEQLKELSKEEQERMNKEQGGHSGIIPPAPLPKETPK